MPNTQDSLARHERVGQLAIAANKAKETLATKALEGDDSRILEAARDYRARNGEWFEVINQSLQEGLCKLRPDPKTGMMALEWFHETQIPRRSIGSTR